MHAAPSIDELLTRAPQLREHTVAPPALAAFAEIRAIERELRAAIAASPDDPRGHALLGNLLARRALYLQARDAYLRAIELDPAFAQAHLAAAELSSILRDNPAAHEHLHRALRIRRRFDDPLPLGNRTPVLMLLRDAPYAVNAPLEVLLDRDRVALHKLYIGEEPSEKLPDCAAVVTGFGVTAAGDSVVARAMKIARALPVATINQPEFLNRASREALAATLDGIDALLPVTSRAVERTALSGVALPALVRPHGTHAGHGLAYIRTRDDLENHIARFPAAVYDVSAFVDYRSADGYYRKYRLAVIDGVAYPYHLAISPRWMVHYQSSPMEEHSWMRSEEEAFLNDPASVFPRWNEITCDIARALRLDYAGLDIARLSDGTMLVFEADPAMLVHDEDEGGIFAYKRPAVGAIREAFHRLLGAEGRTPAKESRRSDA